LSLVWSATHRCLLCLWPAAACVDLIVVSCVRSGLLTLRPQLVARLFHISDGYTGSQRRIRAKPRTLAAAVSAAVADTPTPASGAHEEATSGTPVAGVDDSGSCAEQDKLGAGATAGGPDVAADTGGVGDPRDCDPVVASSPSSSSSPVQTPVEQHDVQVGVVTTRRGVHGSALNHTVPSLFRQAALDVPPDGAQQHRLQQQSSTTQREKQAALDVLLGAHGSLTTKQTLQEFADSFNSDRAHEFEELHELWRHVKDDVDRELKSKHQTPVRMTWRYVRDLNSI